MYDVDSRCVAGQKRRFFHRRIAAADYDQTLITKSGKWSITSRTRRDPVAAKTVRRFCFAGNPEPFRRGSGRDNQRVRLYGFVVGVKREWTRLQVHFINPLFQKLSAEPFRLF